MRGSAASVGFAFGAARGIAMDGLRMGLSFGAAALTDALETAQEQARATAGRVSAETAAAAERARLATLEAAEQARLQAAEVAAIDITKIDPFAKMEQLRESAKESAAALGSSATDLSSRLGTVGWSPARAGADLESGGAKQSEKQSDGEGSESGPEETASWAAGSLLGRLGLSGSRSAELEQLVAKEGRKDSDGGGSAGWRSVGLSGLGSSVADLSSSVGGRLGLVERPKEPPGPCARLCAPLCACCPALTYKQRLLGTVVCFLFGLIISFSALNSLPGLLLGNPAPFAFKYTLGNLLSMGSSSFLVGPEKQCRDMLAPERRLASIVYFVALAGTLLSVFVLKVTILSFAFVLLQFCALTWYMLSYVPYGQQCLRRFVSRMLK